MHEAYYKDTIITLIEAVLVSFLDVDFERDLIYWDIFRNNQFEEFSKTTIKNLQEFSRKYT